MLNKYNFTSFQKNADIIKSEAKEPVITMEKTQINSSISWGEMIILIVVCMLFLVALVGRIVYEYRTDDYSNLEVQVDSCIFQNNTLIRYDNSNVIVDIPTFYEVKNEKYGITAIADYVFYGNSVVQKITMPNQITKVGIFAFRECTNLESITLSDKLERLGDSCFWNCYKLNSVKLPESLKTIEPYAFWNTGITTIDISENVKEIGLGAFNNCSKLETVYMRSTDKVSTWFTEAYQTFSRCPNLKTIYVPESLIEDYKNDQFWSLYRDKFTAIGGNINA